MFSYQANTTSLVLAWAIHTIECVLLLESALHWYSIQSIIFVLALLVRKSLQSLQSLQSLSSLSLVLNSVNHVRPSTASQKIHSVLREHILLSVYVHSCTYSYSKYPQVDLQNISKIRAYSN